MIEESLKLFKEKMKIREDNKRARNQEIVENMNRLNSSVKKKHDILGETRYSGIEGTTNDDLGVDPSLGMYIGGPDATEADIVSVKQKMMKLS
jgi:hypothetical protein